MKLIDPETVNDTVLDATNVAETLSAYSAATVYYTGQQVRDDTEHKAYESATGAAPVTVTITIATPGVVTQTAHGLTNGTTVAFSTTGSLPTGLVAGTVYYVVNAATDTYEVSATSGGSSIATSGTQSGTHSVISSPNKGNALSDATKWIDLGPTNPWGMFDRKLGTLTTNADTIEVTLVPAGRVTGMALFGLDAASVTVTVTDATDGVVFGPEEYSLSNSDNVADYYGYCFNPIIRKTELLVEGLPPYVAPDIDVVIDNTGGDAVCGNLVLGAMRELGATVYGSGFGILDASVKQDDDFGNIDLVERTYRSTASLDVVVDRLMVDEVKRVLAARRATPTVYSGTGDYDATLIYGFPRSWGVSITQHQQSRLTIDLESLA